jgi:hypothetical protein
MASAHSFQPAVPDTAAAASAGRSATPLTAAACP